MELLLDPERDVLGGDRPVVSLRDDEDPDFAEAAERLATARVELRRRGAWHGAWVELGRLGAGARPDPLERVRGGLPALLPGALAQLPGRLADDLEEALVRAEDLARPGGLGRWLAERSHRLPAGLRAGGRLPLEDEERDVERIALSSGDGADLWIKVSRLSAHPDDASLRMRFSFGREGDDDAAHDPERHRAVASLSARLLPEVRAVLDDPPLRRLLDSAWSSPVQPGQTIAYWNAPQGGALFHHDAFDEPRERRQLGVLFVQLVGRTAWLALDVATLAARVREFVGHLSDGELPWVREDLFGGPRGPGACSLDLAQALQLARDDERLVRELAAPGCGALAPLVNRGPEFTAFLADAGHACLLRPGDVLLLPNEGLARTTMHSVFCASPDVTYGLSFGLRADPDRPPLPDDGSSGGRASQRDGGARDRGGRGQRRGGGGDRGRRGARSRGGEGGGREGDTRARRGDRAGGRGREARRGRTRDRRGSAEGR